MARKPEKHLLEICEGQAGAAVYLNNYRIAGPRHNGLMKTIHSWQIHPDDLANAIAENNHAD